MVANRAMRLGDFVFRPALIPSLITVMLLAVLLVLGCWQLDRARHKQAMQAAFTARVALPAVPLGALELDDDASRFRTVTVKGRYDARHQLLLDNQVQNGRVGFHVLTPIRIPGMAEAVLVNRGWIPLRQSRQQLPDITPADTEVAIGGWIDQPANPGLRLGETAFATRRWPRVVEYVDYGQLTAELGYPLAPAVILLDPESEGGYQRDWDLPFAGFGPQRHRGYAVQWFSLAVALSVIFIVVNMHRC